MSRSATRTMTAGRHGLGPRPRGEAGSVAQGEDPGLVDLVVTDPAVGRHRIPLRVGSGLLERLEGLTGRDHVPSRVGPDLVVVADEDVELPLELGDGVGSVLLAQPALEGLVKPLDLPLGSGDGRARRA
jgi:hypothetical protein